MNKTAAEAAAFVDKTLSFVLQQIRDAAGPTPVYFALGNCDSYTGYGPDSAFLSHNAEQLSTLALHGAGNRQDVMTSIARGGYYSVAREDLNVTIVALNTIAFSPLVPPDPDLIAAQFSWFDAQLAKASADGRKVWLLMHAPPGADEGTTAALANDNGRIMAATMMWVDEIQATFMGILEKYPGLVAFSLAGHTHMDEFRLMAPGNALTISAGISPCFGNNPAYKIFVLDACSLAPTDYAALNCNLLATSPQFASYYSFSQAYGFHGPLAASFADLFPALLASGAAKNQYQFAFCSGNTASSPITSTNWPVYWCGIGFSNQKEFLAAVNAF